MGPAGQFAGHGLVRLPDGRVGPHDDLVLPTFALGAGFDAREHLTDESVEAFVRLGGVFEHFVDDDVELGQETGYRQVADVGGYYLPHMAERGFCAAIVRPDYYLFGVCKTADDVQRLVDDLLEQLGAETPAKSVAAASGTTA